MIEMLFSNFEFYRKLKGGRWYFFEEVEIGGGMSSGMYNGWTRTKPIESDVPMDHCKILKQVDY